MSDKPSTGMIVRVTGTDASGVGLLRNVAYYVKFNTALGISDELGPLKPSNRRPVNNDDAEIVAAKSGDICALYWEGDQVYIMVIEGIAYAECSGEGDPNPPPPPGKGEGPPIGRADGDTPVIDEGGNGA